jgi:phage/plasmid-associated DNA primase
MPQPLGESSVDEYIHFTIPNITTYISKKSGLEKKKLNGMPLKWTTAINANNYKQYINPKHKVKCIITGEINNITIVDFDNKNTYFKVLELYPNLKNYKTIETRRGFHVYCKYDANILTCTCACKTFEGIDIANDGHMVIGTGSTYTTLDFDIFEYKDLGGEILEIPNLIIHDLKQNEIKQVEPTIPIATIINSVEPLMESITDSNEYNEINFYIENNCFNEYVLTGEHLKWITLGGMFLSVFSKEDSFKLWEKATLLNGSEDKKNEYKKHFDCLKQIENDKLKAFRILVKWATKGNPNATNEYKQIKKNQLKEKNDQLKQIKKDEENKSIDIPDNLIKWSNCEEADFAKLYKTIIHEDSQILFTGEEKELDGFLFNGVYFKPLSLHDSELHKEHFDVLFEKYSDGLNEIREQVLDLSIKTHLHFYNFTKTKIDKLKTFNTRNNVIKIFKRDNYIQNINWNKNENLFVFEDAIYDLEKGEFVEGDFNDFINYSCGLNYKNNYTKEQLDKAKNTIIDFIKSIVDIDNFEYLMILMASFLKQENKEELAHFWLGNGRNGKGTLAEILMKSLGNYWAELNIDNYTNYEKGKDRPNQNLFNCQKGRVLNTSEIGENINTGLGITFLSDNFKRYSGGDMIIARELGTKRIAKFKAGKQLIQTNIMPTFSKIDNPLKQRIRVVPFPYTFTDDEELLKKDSTKNKIKDINLKKTLTDDLHRIAFTNLLFEYYKEYIVKGLVLTDSIKKHTQSYFKSETLINWIENNCEKKEKESISFEFIKIKFKEESGKTMSIKQIQDEFIGIGCETTRRNLIGWIYKQDIEDTKK